MSTEFLNDTTNSNLNVDNVNKRMNHETQLSTDNGQKKLDSSVTAYLDEIYGTGKLLPTDLDSRALIALNEFSVGDALCVLTQLRESNLDHVTNKSAYLCSIMKSYRLKMRSNKIYNFNTSLNLSSMSRALSTVELGRNRLNSTLNGTSHYPDESKIRELLEERTDYALDVTTGQRRYGPPSNWKGPPPSKGCEIFCGKIPRDLYEDVLIPLFEKCGIIWDFRLMIDPLTGLNRGFAFVTFSNPKEALEAVKQLDSYELKGGKGLSVNISLPKTRLFIGNIPKTKSRNDIAEEFGKNSVELKDVIIYSSPNDKKKNRGFCFLEYETHKAASLAKRRFEGGKVRIWNCDIIVDWADPLLEPDEHVMGMVKVLYVRNLTTSVTEDRLFEIFSVYGNVERVKRIKDYAFVHFERREDTLKALESMQTGYVLDQSCIEVSLAKPPSDKRGKEDVLRRREQRIMNNMLKGMSCAKWQGQLWSGNNYSGMQPNGNEQRGHYPCDSATLSFTCLGGSHTNWSNIMLPPHVMLPWSNKDPWVLTWPNINGVYNESNYRDSFNINSFSSQNTFHNVSQYNDFSCVAH